MNKRKGPKLSSKPLFFSVGRAGIEPATSGLKVPRNQLPTTIGHKLQQYFQPDSVPALRLPVANSGCNLSRSVPPVSHGTGLNVQALAGFLILLLAADKGGRQRLIIVNEPDPLDAFLGLRSCYPPLGHVSGQALAGAWSQSAKHFTLLTDLETPMVLIITSSTGGVIMKVFAVIGSPRLS